MPLTNEGRRANTVNDIHPTAIIGDGVELGQGNVIGSFVDSRGEYESATGTG